MKKLTKILLLAALLMATVAMLAACGNKATAKSITIYSTAEDYRNEHARQMLTEKFPEYDINLVDIGTGTLAAKLAAEGTETDADIIMELESTYLEKVSDSLATLTNVDFSVYVDELVPEHHKYVPWYRLCGGMIVDTEALAAKNLPAPASYDDLLKPEYKGLISMPSPKSSSTGYIFLLNMVNERGEEAAFAYFDQLAENMSGQGFTTSGSGPVKALLTGEAAIGLGITYQAVEMINEGSNFEIVFFAEGAPYTTGGSAVIAGRETDEDIMKVFDYIVSDVTPTDKELYAPERIYKEQEIKVPNYPQNIPYGNMDGIRDIELKERLLDKWNH